MQLKGSKTHGNLKAAFAGESQANRRYLYFAAKADVEGQNDVAAVFRSTAEGETGHAHGHLEYLEQCGDPATDLPFGGTRLNLKAAIAGETHEYTDMYPGMSKRRRAIRSRGARRSSTRKPSSSAKWSGCSASVTAAGAASTCARRFRRFSISWTRAQPWKSTVWRNRSSGRSLTSATSATCAT